MFNGQHIVNFYGLKKCQGFGCFNLLRWIYAEQFTLQT